MDVSEARRLKSLEEENERLKRLFSDAMHDNAALKTILGKDLTPTAERPSAARRSAAGRPQTTARCGSGCGRSRGSVGDPAAGALTKLTIVYGERFVTQ